jgi:hypothetical protein
LLVVQTTGDSPMDILKQDEKFRYQLLSRMQMDCDYYLGHGNRSPKHLWANDEKEQIQDMKDLYNSFDDDKKPEWITLTDIEEYEKKMLQTV